MKSAIAIALSTLALLSIPAQAAPRFSFGNDSSTYANDGECDDARFSGSGMTGTPLLSDDILSDASDCRAAYEAGTLTLRGVADDGVPDFGNDKGDYANDGECDDMRFKGEGMTQTALIEDDIMRDASDCRAAFEAGTIRLNLK